MLARSNLSCHRNFYEFVQNRVGNYWFWESRDLRTGSHSRNTELDYRLRLATKSDVHILGSDGMRWAKTRGADVIYPRRWHMCCASVLSFLLYGSKMFVTYRFSITLVRVVSLGLEWVTARGMWTLGIYYSVPIQRMACRNELNLVDYDGWVVFYISKAYLCLIFRSPSGV